MCGRYVLYGPGEALIEGFSLVDLPPFSARYNIAPASTVLVVRDEPGRGRVAESMRWGLVPHWARDASIGARLVNARGETVAEKPAFRQALRRSRCLIPANGFYEWRAPAAGSRGRKQPFYIHARDGGLIAMAGLFERWQGPEGPLATCCIVTTAANPLMSAIHDRMPVLLDRPDGPRGSIRRSATRRRSRRCFSRVPTTGSRCMRSRPTSATRAARAPC
ncbi:MAG: SOS response-associated peptidase [Burkholderiaceae bacterium]|nr:SOS response-associated peptidase [Burkholderiaceae bacterium]